MIDYVFRYDPALQGLHRSPANSDEARQTLIEGNRVFSKWMAKCGRGVCTGEDLQFVVSGSGLAMADAPASDGYPVQRPFAVVIGCSDARVPTEMLFGQGFNDLFVIRVAGNVLGEDVQGTIDYSTLSLGESVRILVVLGHNNCGAIKGAVDSYLDPKRFWSRAHSQSLRLILQRIFVAVRESDHALRLAWGGDTTTPGYREALVDMAVCLNAAHTAFSLRQQIEGAGNWDVEVLYGVYDIRTHQVCMPIHPGEPGDDPDPEHVTLVSAPSHPREFAALATELAGLLSRHKPGQVAPKVVADPRPPREAE